jgi:hypothetical protein
MSPTETPDFTGPVSGWPMPLMTPDIAWAMRSKPGR